MAAVGKYRDRLTGALACAIAVSLYLAFTWNRSLGLDTEGWFQFYAGLMRTGLMPYRDFYLFSTPGHLLETVAVSNWIGAGCDMFRLVGGIQRVLMAVLLYWWLARFWPVIPSLYAALLSVLVYSSDPADVLFYINHSSMFWALAGCLAMSYAVDRKSGWMGLGSGFAVGWSFLDKQTIGIGTGLWLLLALLVVYCRADRIYVKIALCYVLGWLLAVAPIGYWLWLNQALPMFGEQVFGRGATSKGTLIEILWRPFSVWSFDLGYLVFGVLLAIWLRQGDKNEPSNSSGKIWPAVLTAVLAIPAGWLCGWVLYQHTGREMDSLRLVQCLLVVGSVAAGPVLFARSVIRSFRDPKDSHSHQVLILSGFSMVVWFFFAISSPLFELMALPGVALAALTFFGRIRPAMEKGSVWVGYLAMTVWFALASNVVAYKMLHPFMFFGYSSPPVYEAPGYSSNPLLRGMSLPHGTAKDVDLAVATLRKYASANGDSFVFPHMPIFYSLAGTKPAVFAPVQWFDVAPDYIVREDVERLKAHPPQVMILMLLEPGQMTQFENFFRGGRSSGQREMTEYLTSLLPQYDLVQTFAAYPESIPIKVWVKKQARLQQ